MSFLSIFKTVASVASKVLPLVVEALPSVRGEQVRHRYYVGNGLALYPYSGGVYARNDSSSDIGMMFSKTSESGGSLFTRTEYLPFAPSGYAPVTSEISTDYQGGIVTVADSDKPYSEFKDVVGGGPYKILTMAASTILVGAGIRIAGPVSFSVQRDTNHPVSSQDRWKVTVGSDRPMTGWNISGTFKDSHGSTASISADAQSKQVASPGLLGSVYEADFPLPEGFQPEPIIESADMKIEMPMTHFYEVTAEARRKIRYDTPPWEKSAS